MTNILSLTDNRASLPTLVPAFLSLVSSLVFGMRYAAIVRSAAPPPVPRPAPPPPPTRESLSAAAAERRMTGASEGAATPRGSVPSVVVTPPEDDSDFLFSKLSWCVRWARGKADAWERLQSALVSSLPSSPDQSSGLGAGSRSF